MRKVFRTCTTVAASLLAVALATTAGQATAAPADAVHHLTPVGQPAAFFGDVCAANDNLGEIANNFISRCRKGAIRSVFPGQHYGDTLGYIKGCGESSCKTAWKLLNDNRFKN